MGEWGIYKGNDGGENAINFFIFFYILFYNIVKIVPIDKDIIFGYENNKSGLWGEL
jgi:hypothetical protein